MVRERCPPGSPPTSSGLDTDVEQAILRRRPGYTPRPTWPRPHSLVDVLLNPAGYNYRTSRDALSPRAGCRSSPPWSAREGDHTHLPTRPATVCTSTSPRMRPDAVPYRPRQGCGCDPHWTYSRRPLDVHVSPCTPRIRPDVMRYPARRVVHTRRYGHAQLALGRFSAANCTLLVDDRHGPLQLYVGRRAANHDGDAVRLHHPRPLHHTPVGEVTCLQRQHHLRLLPGLE